MNDFTFNIREAHGHPGNLTKEDVWGDPLNPANPHNGMVVGKSYQLCPIWGDQIPYKSVTIVCPAEQLEEVTYWLEYVHGGGSISQMAELPGDRIALRSDYKCW